MIDYFVDAFLFSNTNTFDSLVSVLTLFSKSGKVSERENLSKTNFKYLGTSMKKKSDRRCLVNNLRESHFYHSWYGLFTEWFVFFVLALKKQSLQGFLKKNSDLFVRTQHCYSLRWLLLLIKNDLQYDVTASSRKGAIKSY